MGEFTYGINGDASGASSETSATIIVGAVVVVLVTECLTDASATAAAPVHTVLPVRR